MLKFLPNFRRLDCRDSNVQSEPRGRRRTLGLVVVGAMLVLSPVLAGEPAPPEAKPASKIKPATAPVAAADVSLPACLERLGLSAPLLTQAKQIVREYDVTLDAVWKQFGEKYLETVRTEVAMLAAIEDSLTEPQRMKVREQRRAVAHAQKALEGTKSKPNQATESPAGAADQVIAGVGISLTDEQEASADKIHEKYVGQLRSLNRDLQGLHNRLVSLEADKLVELEKMLTPEQLTQVRERRQAAAEGAKLTSTGRSAGAAK